MTDRSAHLNGNLGKPTGPGTSGRILVRLREGDSKGSYVGMVKSIKMKNLKVVPCADGQSYPTRESTDFLWDQKYHDTLVHTGKSAKESLRFLRRCLQQHDGTTGTCKENEQREAVLRRQISDLEKRV